MESTNEIVEVQPRSIFDLKIVFIILSVVALFAVSIAGYLYTDTLKNTYQAQIDSKDLQIITLTTASTDLSTQLSKLQSDFEAFQQSVCKGNWKPGEGCVKDQISLLAPRGGEVLCFGQTVEVLWNPDLIDTDVLEIQLQRPRSGGILANLPTQSGVFKWKIQEVHQRVGSTGTLAISEGDVYKIYLQTGGNVIPPGNQSGPFTIKHCEV